MNTRHPWTYFTVIYWRRADWLLEVDQPDTAPNYSVATPPSYRTLVGIKL